jgi:hypothetical protein
MKTKILLILMGLISALKCCATTNQSINVTIVASSGQRITHINGKEFITSQKKHLVSLSPYSVPNIARDKIKCGHRAGWLLIMPLSVS